MLIGYQDLVSIGNNDNQRFISKLPKWFIFWASAFISRIYFELIFKMIFTFSLKSTKEINFLAQFNSGKENI